MRIISFGFCMLIASSPAFAMGDRFSASPDAASLSDLMVGAFQTSSSDSENDFIDRRVALAPLGEGHWLYYQINSGPESAVYRQRVIQLLDEEDGTVVQNTYNLIKPEAYENVFEDPAPLEGVSMEHIEPTMGDGCQQIWRHDSEIEGGPWVGVVDKANCQIYSERRESTIAIGAEVRLSDDTLYTTEKGYDQEGNILFGGPEGSFIILNRVTE